MDDISQIKEQPITETRDQRMLSETFTRGAKASVVNIDEANRTVELSFASEVEVERWYGIEVLEMSSRAADLNRLNNGGALLSDHNHGRQIGKVVKAWVGDDKRAHAIVKFSQREAAQEEFQDVIDGIRTNVSFGYRVTDYKTEKGQGNAPDKRTVTGWEAFEISLVAVPADPTVGVGRAQEDLGQPEQVVKVRLEVDTTEAEQKLENIKRGSNQNMENENPGTGQPAAEVTFSREDQILAYGQKFGADINLTRMIANRADGTVAMLQAELGKQYEAIEATRSAPELKTEPTSKIGLTEKETKRYSISRAIIAQADNDWSKAEFERECHTAIESNLDSSVLKARQSSGFFVPHEVQAQRDLSVTGGNTSGGYIVNQADHQPQNFIELLRNNMVMLQSGVTLMSDLVGNPSIPRQNGASTGYWVAEGVAPTESQLTLGQLTMSPKTCGALTEFTRQLLIQSSPSVDQLVKSDIAEVLARTIDLAIIDGSGSAGQPTGIINTSGVTEITLSGSGSAFDWSDALEFESTLATNNTQKARSWITTPSVLGILKGRPKIGSTFPVFLVGDDGKMNGYPVITTTQMPSATMIYGDYSTVILGEWGVLEIEANKYGSSFGHGGIQVRGLHMVDVAVRYPQALLKTTAFL